jgi:hypothetical protein
MAIDVRLQDLVRVPISIPWSTGDPSLDPQADAWLYRIPHPKDPKLLDFIITPVDPTTWQDLWTVTLATEDSPRIIARFAKFLGDHEINVISMTSCTTEQGQYNSSTLLIDCARYHSDVDRDNAYRSSHPNATLNHLRRGLVVEFIREVVPPPYPSVAIERSIPFWSLHQERLRSGVVARGQRLKVSNGAINIPPAETRRIFSGVDRAQSRASKVLISVDRSTDLVRAFPFSPNCGIVALVASTDNIPGAIGEVARCLGNADINILAAKAWASKDHRRTSLWLLLDVRRRGRTALNDGDVLNHLIELLRSDKELRRFDLVINVSKGG